MHAARDFCFHLSNYDGRAHTMECQSNGVVSLRAGCLSIKISTPPTTSSWRAQIGCLEKKDLSRRVSHAIICYFRLLCRRLTIYYLYLSRWRFARRFTISLFYAQLLVVCNLVVGYGFTFSSGPPAEIATLGERACANNRKSRASRMMSHV